MLWKHGRSVYIFAKCMQENLHATTSGVSVQQVRHIKKHWNPKFKRLRAEKVQPPLKLFMEHMDEKYSYDVSEEKLRSRLRRMNIRKDLDVVESHYYTSSSNVIYDPYQPPEGDGKLSFSKEKALKQVKKVQAPIKRLMALRKIRYYDHDFDKTLFLNEALQIYIKAHECLTQRDKEKLIDYVTPSVYGMMVENTQRKSIVWKYLASLEPPSLVHVTLAEADKTYLFGQLTVRLHSEQQLAIYDRFGRLMQGSEILRKDVLEYVVFEKNLVDECGSWRIAGKIKPRPLPPIEPINGTYVVSKENPNDVKPENSVMQQDANVSHQAEETVQVQQPL